MSTWHEFTLLFYLITEKMTSRAVLGSSHARFLGVMKDTDVISIGGGTFPILTNYVKSVEGSSLLKQKKTILILAGGNDIDRADHSKIPLILLSLSSLIKCIRLLNCTATIIVASPLPRPARDPKDLRLSFSQSLKAFLSDMDNCRFLNLEKSFCVGRKSANPADGALFDWSGPYPGVHLLQQSSFLLKGRICQGLGASANPHLAGSLRRRKSSQFK